MPGAQTTGLASSLPSMAQVLDAEGCHGIAYHECLTCYDMASRTMNVLHVMPRGAMASRTMNVLHVMT